MAYTTDRTWVTAEVVTAAYFNTYLRDNVKWLSTDKPMCRAYSSGDFSHNSSGAALSVTFDSESFDNSTVHSTSSNTHVFTAPVDGKYLMGSHSRWDANATGLRSTQISTGVNIAYSEAVATASANLSWGDVAFQSFSASGTVGMTAFQNSGGTRTLSVPAFWIFWVGN